MDELSSRHDEAAGGAIGGSSRRRGQRANKEPRRNVARGRLDRWRLDLGLGAGLTDGEMRLARGSHGREVDPLRRRQARLGGDQLVDRAVGPFRPNAVVGGGRPGPRRVRGKHLRHQLGPVVERAGQRAGRDRCSPRRSEPGAASGPGERLRAFHGLLGADGQNGLTHSCRFPGGSCGPEGSTGRGERGGRRDALAQFLGTKMGKTTVW